MSTEKPVVFLAFANEYEANRRLDNVVKEREQLESILNEAYRNGLCDKPVVRQNVSIKTFLDILGSDEYKNRIAIIHYGGHADGYQLLLEGLDGKRQVAKGDGLVNILSRRENQENMKLVFLNGCSTERLAKALTGRGVPIVIGTSTSIKDEQALTVATRFYTGLANGLTMAGAWADAKNEVESVTDAADTVRGSEKSRGIVIPKEETDSFPWEESFRDSAAEVDFKNWNLPEVSKNPLFNLPPLEKTQLPASPFLFLKPYEARHAEIFFGRSSYIRDLWLKVNERNAPSIIMLYGESGAGKSSLLDAGLRPRLEAAKNKDGGKRFEIRYRRRDHIQGLVRTFAEMLSFQPEEEVEELTASEEPEADPNLEKLQKIEALAEGLEEETANTFRSVINRYRSIRAYRPRKQSSRGLYHEEANGNLILDKEAGSRLRKAWIKLEKETGRELIIILDQAEEAITQPNPRIENELEGLLRVLKDIFVRPPDGKEDKARGKIILGYREEFNAKILARSQEYELSPSTVFLEQLRGKDIEEIFRELPRLRGINYYNLTIEKGLPEKIANDLLRGRSAVAPVLQLLLTKLWDNTYDPDKNSAYFSIRAYSEAQSGGKEMEKYFREQMEAVRKWKPEVVESGLVLDVLQFHVTELGTSRRRNFETDIRPRYQHLEEEEEYEYPPGFVETLVKKLKSPEIFLLNDDGRGYTSLPHDTLAPVVRREYDRSDKLGQRSARILEVKKPDLDRAREEEELRKLRLNDNDLDVVWKGKKGMRGLNERERALLEISRTEREKRLRQRRAWAKAGIVGGLFILALSILAGLLSVSVNEQLKEQVISKALDASLIEQDKTTDKLDKAIQLGQFAYNKSPIRRIDVVNNLYNLYGKGSEGDPYSDTAPAAEESGPLSITLKPGGRIDALDYIAPFGPFLVQYRDSLVKYWPKPGIEQTIRLASNEEGLKREVRLSADGKKVEAISYDYREPRYILNGKLVEGLWIPVYASVSTFEKDFPYLGYYDFVTGKVFDEYGRSYSKEEFTEVNYESLNQDGEYFLNLEMPSQDDLPYYAPISVDTLFSIVLMNERNGLLDTIAYAKARKIDWWRAVSGKLDNVNPSGSNSLRKTNLSLISYKDIRSWDPARSEKGPGSLAIDNTLLYFQAIDENRYLAVDGNQELVMLIPNGSQLDTVTLLRAEDGLLDIAISPNRRYIFAMTNKLAFICDLSGVLLSIHAHENIAGYSFSEDGYHLLTVSEDTVKVFAWQSGNDSTSLSVYTPAQDTTLPRNTRIAMARFHENEGYLVIGLESTTPAPRLGGFFNWLKSLLPGGNKKRQKVEQPIMARVVYWDYQRDKNPAVTFEGPNGRLFDATVSRDGQFAVALQATKAAIIPKNKGMLPADSLVVEAAGFKGRLNGRKASKVRLSPCGKYIIRQSPELVEVFTPDGKKANTYQFKSGFQPGFNGQLFSPDDHFMISEQSDEVFFWNPDDREIREWSGAYVLPLDEKRDHELTTFMDEVPGASDRAKWWALRVLLASLIFILVYYADLIIESIQEKKYLEPALYFAGFSVFSLYLAFLWIEGAYYPEIRKGVFYSIFWAMLALLSLGIYGFRKKLKTLWAGQAGATFSEQLRYWFSQLPKYGALFIFIAVGLFVLAGAVIFFRIEYPEGGERRLLLAGLLIPLIFGGLIGYPIYRLTGAYRAGNFSALYRWLLLPAGLIILIFWLIYSANFDDGYGDAVAALLSLVSILILLWAIFRQCRAYLISRQYVPFAAFAVPVAAILLFLTVSAADTHLAVFFTLALPTAFIYGRKYRRQGNYKAAFLLFSIVIFLVAGVLAWAELALINAVPTGLLLAAALALLFIGMRKQLKNRAARRAGGKPAWPNWLAIAGLWAAAIFSTAAFTGAMVDSTYALEDDYDDYIFEEDAYWEEEVDADSLDGNVGLINEPGLEDSLSDEAVSSALDSFQHEETDTEPALPADVDFGAPVLNNRQQLIVRLFDPDAVTRERALTELETYWTDDRALIPELIQYSSENPEKEEGIFEALGLLAAQSDQMLQTNRSLLGPYLERVAQMELGAGEQIQELRDRMGY